MKKTILMIILCLMLISLLLVGCDGKSADEKRLEELRNAASKTNDYYQQQKSNYDTLVEKVDEYESLRDKLN